MKNQKAAKGLWWRIGLSVVLLGAASYVLAVHWGTVAQGLNTARHAQAGWLGLALVCMVLTWYVAAGIYGQLALHRLRYRQTVLIELAAAFVNRLLPSGLGGLGLHGLYLYRRRHTAAEATAIVSVNNILGVAVHACLLLLLIALDPGVLRDVHIGTVHVSWRPIAVVAGMVLLIVLLPPIRRHLRSFAQSLLISLSRIQRIRLLRAAGIAAVLTCVYTLILVCTARSVGVWLGLPKTFAVFSVGMLIGNAIPTPGGLVGAEAGLFAGFVGYGVSDANATAAVLLFRLVSYWLPLLPGACALLLARNRRLV